MRIVLLLIGMFFFMSPVQAQYINTDSLPEFYRKGDTIVGVVFSLEQAQKIDKDKELLTLYRLLVSQMESGRIAQMEVINLQNKTIQEKSNLILEQSEQLKNYQTRTIQKDSLISAQKSELILEKNEKEILKQVIKNKDDKIGKLKGDRIILGASTLLFIILSLVN